jgi:AraC-like DNA-binding protein
MMPYFHADHTPDEALLEVKFKELILLLADHPVNEELLAWFGSLFVQPRKISLQQVMEENFCFNLKLDEFAKLSARSLSAFKREFRQVYRTSPGKWLLEKRLNHTMYLLTRMGRNVTEAAYESGFESPSHLSRTFRRRFGNSPASVRQVTAV